MVFVYMLPWKRRENRKNYQKVSEKKNAHTTGHAVIQYITGILMRLVLMIFFQVHIKLFLYKHCQGHLYQLDYLKTEIDRYRHDYGIKR